MHWDDDEEPVGADPPPIDGAGPGEGPRDDGRRTRPSFGDLWYLLQKIAEVIFDLLTLRFDVPIAMLTNGLGAWIFRDS